MAGYLNKVQLIGNLGRDPEIRSVQGGKVLALPAVPIAAGTAIIFKPETLVRWHRSDFLAR